MMTEFESYEDALVDSLCGAIGAHGTLQHVTLGGHDIVVGRGEL